MSWLNRLKLLTGIIIVLLIVGLLTLLFNQRQNQVVSLNAHVEAPRTVIASPYAGVVTDQKHSPGEYVNAGDALFTISSASLKDLLATGTEVSSTEGYEVDINAGTVTFVATIDGYLEEYTAFQGTFIGSGEQVATIVSQKNKTVLARFTLNPSDYGRIETNGPVTIHLPDGQLVNGNVLSVKIDDDEAGGATVTEVTVVSEELQAEDLELLTRRGTPVTAIMSLRDDGLLAGPTEALRQFLVQIGLR